MARTNGRRKRSTRASEKQRLVLQSNTREGMDAAREQGKWTGRPPFGFDVGAEGYLSPNDDYETALVLIDELDKGISKSQLARRAGVSRMTIMRIDENRARYLSRC